MIALLAGSALACGFLTDKLAEKASEKVAEEVAERAMEASGGKDVEVDLSSGSGQVSIKSGDGATSVQLGGGAEIPSGFPSDIPIYPGAKVTGSWQVNEADKGVGTAVVFESSDAPATIAAFYKDRLGGALALKAEANMGGAYTLAFASADEKRSCAIQLSPGSTGTSGMLTAFTK